MWLDREFVVGWLPQGLKVLQLVLIICVKHCSRGIEHFGNCFWGGNRVGKVKGRKARISVLMTLVILFGFAGIAKVDKGGQGQRAQVTRGIDHAVLWHRHSQ